MLVYGVTIAFKNLLTFNGDFSFGKSQEVAGSQIWAVGLLTYLGNSMFCKNTCARAAEWAGALMQIG
jgi:hypothetical protein